MVCRHHLAAHQIVTEGRLDSALRSATCISYAFYLLQDLTSNSDSALGYGVNKCYDEEDEDEEDEDEVGGDVVVLVMEDKKEDPRVMTSLNIARKDEEDC